MTFPPGAAPSPPESAGPPDYPQAADYGVDGDCRKRKRILAAALATLLAAGGGAYACWSSYQAEIARRESAVRQRILGRIKAPRPPPSLSTVRR